MRTNTFDKLSFLSLFLVVILLPFFFLPFTNIPVEISKGLLLVIGLALCVIFWAIARFFDGKISFPKSVSILGGAGIVLIFLLSTIFSKTSFFGTMFDVGSFWFIFSSFLLMLCASIIFRTPKQAKIVLFGAILSSAIVLIFQGARLFVPELLSFGILAGKTDTILGSWNSFGLFAGFSALMSLLVVEFFSTTKIEKWILGALTTLSIILIAVVNFPLVWVLLGISSLIIFIYKISISAKENQATDTAQKGVRFPALSFTVIMITLLFFIAGASVGTILPNRLGIQNNEVGPSFISTMLVTKSVIKESPVLGIGPNKFSEAWAMYKPISVNSTIKGNDFWNVAFNSGSGLLPTLVSTTGILGILAWLVFFVLFITSGIKSVFSSIKNGVNWETMAFFVLSLYLFISSFFYSTGPVIFLLAFAFAGIFIGLSASNRSGGEISFSFLNDHRKSFFSLLLIFLVIILSAATSFKYVERFVSVAYFRKAITTPTISVAEASINRAIALYPNDLYLRAYAQVYLVKFNSLVSKGDSLTEAEKADLQVNLDQAVNSAQLAAGYDSVSKTYSSKNYLNFQTLGSVYQILASFGVKDAYSKAVEAYKLASVLNPLNPGIKLEMANASFADGKTKEAKEYANAALSLKPDYINALVVLSQIAKKEGDNAKALSYARTALSLSPADKNLIQYVDSLKSGSASNADASSGDTDKKKQ